MYILWVAADVLVGLWEDRGNAGDRAAGVVGRITRISPFVYNYSSLTQIIYLRGK